MHHASVVSNEPLAQSAHTPMRRVALASLVGTTIEYYDFFIYGTAAALVFPSAFFPTLSPAIATIAAFSTFAAAFLSRPLGAAFFGHVGDRIGRKKTLVATMLTTGISTVAVGTIPTAASIGIAAPLILVSLRLVQGFGVGGEWAGSALLSAEYAPDGKRGAFGMFTPLGAVLGATTGSFTFFVVDAVFGQSSPAFESWGWRVPFLLSAALVIVALYVRLHVDETPVFAADRQRNPRAGSPIRELLGHQLGRVLLGSGVALVDFTFIFMGATYFVGYADTQLGFPRQMILLITVLGGLVAIAITVFAAILSDRLGRKRVAMFGGALAIPWSLIVFPLFDTRSAIALVAGIVGTFAILGVCQAPLASLLTELFATRHRYTGTGLALNLAGILGGALPPVIAGALLPEFGSWAIGLMMAILALASLVCCYLLPETSGWTLHR